MSLISSDEIPAGGFYYFFGHNGSLIGHQNVFNLHHQVLGEANIASREATDSGNGDESQLDSTIGGY